MHTSPLKPAAAILSSGSLRRFCRTPETWGPGLDGTKGLGGPVLRCPLVRQLSSSKLKARHRPRSDVNPASCCTSVILASSRLAESGRLRICEDIDRHTLASGRPACLPTVRHLRRKPGALAESVLNPQDNGERLNSKEMRQISRDDIPSFRLSEAGGHGSPADRRPGCHQPQRGRRLRLEGSGNAGLTGLRPLGLNETP